MIVCANRLGLGASSVGLGERTNLALKNSSADLAALGAWRSWPI